MTERRLKLKTCAKHRYALWKILRKEFQAMTASGVLLEGVAESEMELRQVAIGHVLMNLRQYAMELTNGDSEFGER